MKMNRASRSMDIDASTGESSSSGGGAASATDSVAWGGLSASCIADRINTMMRQERDAYDYRRYVRQPDDEMEEDLQDDSRGGGAQQDVQLNSSWREKICHWSYSVVDHFELSRETVAISIDLFDRYLATRGNKCNGSSALLTSLTTLYIAIKLNEPKKIKLTTLSNLSRGQFFPPDIEEMEYKILSSLSWMVHPPTTVSFVSHLLLFLPQVHPSVRKDIFELSRYLAELSICDAYFVEYDSSTIAYASVLNIMDDISLARISTSARNRFRQELTAKVGLDSRASDVSSARERLKEIFASSMGYDPTQEQQGSKDGASAAVGAASASTPSPSKASTSSIGSGPHKGFGAQPAQTDDVSLMGYANRARTNSSGSSVGSYKSGRYSASPSRGSRSRGGGIRSMRSWSRQ